MPTYYVHTTMPGGAMLTRSFKSLPTAQRHARAARLAGEQARIQRVEDRPHSRFHPGCDCEACSVAAVDFLRR